MQYSVHRVKVDKGDIAENLEQFLNGLRGDVVSVFPNVTPTFEPMGATATVDSLWVVEKVGQLNSD